MSDSKSVLDVFKAGVTGKRYKCNVCSKEMGTDFVFWGEQASFKVLDNTQGQCNPEIPSSTLFRILLLCPQCSVPIAELDITEHPKTNSSTFFSRLIKKFIGK